MKIIYIFLISIIIMIAIVSCRTGFEKQIFEYHPVINVDPDTLSTEEMIKIGLGIEKKSIIIINDSVIIYTKRFGGISFSDSIKYKLNQNILTIDSVNYFNKRIDISNMDFYYYKDSIVSIQASNERYLNKKYLNKLKVKIK